MLHKDSRYQDCPRFAAQADGSVPFKGLRPRAIGPASGVLEHVFQPGERLEALAGEYYNDPRRWWRIVDANADVACAAEVELLGLPPLPGDGALPAEDEFGEVLLVPKTKE